MEQYQIMLNEKKNKNGYKLVTIEKHKVKLVTKRYPQAYGVDQKEIFVSIMKMNIVHVLVYISSNHERPLFQIDVKNMFLYKDLKEIYISLLIKMSSRFPNTFSI